MRKIVFLVLGIILLLAWPLSAQAILHTWDHQLQNNWANRRAPAVDLSSYLPDNREDGWFQPIGEASPEIFYCAAIFEKIRPMIEHFFSPHRWSRELNWQEDKVEAAPVSEPAPFLLVLLGLTLMLFWYNRQKQIA